MHGDSDPVVLIDTKVPRGKGRLNYKLQYDVHHAYSFNRMHPVELEYGPEAHLTLSADFPVDPE